MHLSSRTNLNYTAHLRIVWLKLCNMFYEYKYKLFVQTVMQESRMIKKVGIWTALKISITYTKKKQSRYKIF